jgi:hypothetical protein
MTRHPHRKAALPFTLRRSHDVIGLSEMTTTTETVHGLLRLDGDRLVIQWRLARKTDRIGGEIRSDQELERVREVAIPLEGIAGATVQRRRWVWLERPRLVLTAADLRAFEAVAGEGGLKLEHPAELVVRLRRGDRLAGEEFGAEVSLALAERMLEGTDLPRPHELPGRAQEPAEDEAPDPPRRASDAS